MSELPAISEIVEKVGMSVATIIGLVLVLKWVSQAYQKELLGRIANLENELKSRDAKIDEREKLILARTDSYAHDMKSIAMQLIANDKANRELLRDYYGAICGLSDRLDRRKCQIEDDLDPHPALGKKQPITRIVKGKF